MTPPVLTDALSGGFADAPVEAARAFRAALEALARPGRVCRLTGAKPPAPLTMAAGTLMLTLADGTTPVHLAPSHDSADLRDWLTFHCGCPLVGAEDAVFALGTWDALLPVNRYPIGTPDYPDRAATLIVEVTALEPPNARLTGPGIAEAAMLRVPDVAIMAANRARFPLGFDCFLTCSDRVVGLPRSTRTEAL
jgi:alpha-D-ribose 1-methylphosphonate 5-triphosphate synthase subunit PhnH